MFAYNFSIAAHLPLIMKKSLKNLLIVLVVTYNYMIILNKIASKDKKTNKLTKIKNITI
jgi:hypothetical protein